MRAAQALYVTALGLWVGGIAVLGALVAPVTFRTASTRPEAGRIFGAVLQVFGPVELVLAGIVIVSCWMARRGSPRESRAGIVRLALAFVMAALCALSVLGVNPVIRQGAAKGAAAMAVDDPARVHFDSMHAWGTRLMGARLAAGLLLLAYSGATLRASDGS